MHPIFSRNNFSLSGAHLINVTVYDNSGISDNNLNNPITIHYLSHLHMAKVSKYLRSDITGKPFRG